MFNKQELPEHLRYKWEESQEKQEELVKAGNDLEARKLSQESLECDASINDVKANHEKNENTIQSGMKGPTPFNAAKKQEVLDEEFEFISQQELEQQNEQQNNQEISITLSPLSLLDDLAVALQNDQDISEMFSQDELEMAQEALQENPEMIPNDQAIILAGVNFKEAIEAAGDGPEKDKKNLYETEQNGTDTGMELGEENTLNNKTEDSYEESQSESTPEPETKRTRPLPTPYDNMRR